jgi:hypothetical protein
MERSIGRAIALAIIVIAIVVVGKIWRPDDPVEDQVGAQEDRIEAASALATQPVNNQTPADGQAAATPSQPGV